MRIYRIIIAVLSILIVSGCIPKQEQNSAVPSVSNDDYTELSSHERLEDAIFKYDHKTFQKLLAESPDADKNKLLALAVFVGDIDIMKTLLKAGADPNYHPDEGNIEANLLFVPSLIHSTEIPKLLIDSGTDIHFRTSDGLTALHAAVEFQDIEKAALLIQRGINVNARSLKGNTPLHTATGTSSTLGYIVDKFEQEGIKLSQKDKNELELHLRATQLEMVSLLLEKGANPNAANKGKLTPLHNAARHGRSQVVRKLITYHANVNILDGQGCTPLVWAIKSDSLETVEVLLANGSDMKKITSPYFSPLHMSAAKGNLAITKALISHGATINHPIMIDDGESNITPLHVAATNNFPEIADLLIKKGADVTVKTSKGQTVLDIINERPERINKFQKSGVFWKINDALYNAL
ncbi:ankyrin repeat domain-containing protein [uncultured Mailhella sp.]|uniref:ankyrin repeat domain-containing protein n=1 Tax=uncultured Mailhella sp. TaxID=1981031 RepID=UPI00320AF3B8